MNITFPDWVIVENSIPKNVIINRGAAKVDNHIPRDDIFVYHSIRECNIYFIIPDSNVRGPKVVIGLRSSVFFWPRSFPSKSSKLLREGII